MRDFNSISSSTNFLDRPTSKNGNENHVESRKMGEINLLTQNRIALVDERFISEAMGSFIADADLQIVFPIVARSVFKLKLCSKYFFVRSAFLICGKNVVRRILSPLIGSSPGGKRPPPDAFLSYERLCRSDGSGMPT
jgi:hypothetical protein